MANDCNHVPTMYVFPSLDFAVTVIYCAHNLYVNFFFFSGFFCVHYLLLLQWRGELIYIYFQIILTTVQTLKSWSTFKKKCRWFIKNRFVLGFRVKITTKERNKYSCDAHNWGRFVKKWPTSVISNKFINIFT